MSKKVGKKFPKWVKVTLCVLLICAFLCSAGVVGINAYVICSVKNYIIDLDEAKQKNFDCAVILGAGLWDGEPSPMLKERLNFGLRIYSTGCTDRILMSGDHGREEYDEVNAMKDYAVEEGVPADSVFMDHAGFSTYETMYRAKEVFEVKTAVIITQKYHLYRAVYDARKLGLDAYGFAADELDYSVKNDLREAAARVKDFFWCLFSPEPTYLGEVIPISGSGSLTDDKVRV